MKHEVLFSCNSSILMNMMLQLQIKMRFAGAFRHQLQSKGTVASMLKDCSFD